MEYILIYIFAVLFAIALVVMRNKKDKEILEYYKETHKASNDLVEKSLTNQKRMIELLENISESLRK